MFKFMRVPFDQAPGDAETQCAELVKKNKAYATVTKGMNALAHGFKCLIKSWAQVKIHLLRFE